MNEGDEIRVQPLRLIVVGASGVMGRAIMQAATNARIPAIGTALRNVTAGLIPYDMTSMSLAKVCHFSSEDIVVLLAGYTSPAWIYENQKLARELNLNSSKRLVDEVAKSGARLLFVSTDQVFNGEVGGLTETSKPDPLNLYGRLKRDMEEHILAYPSNVVVRTGWNVGWDRASHCAVSQCYETLLRPNAKMAADNIINVTDIDDTAQGIVKICCAKSPFPIYHLVSGEGITRTELAFTVQKHSILGANMSYEEISFASLSYSEPRPIRAFLRSERMSSLGLSFSEPKSVIHRKVELLDRWYAEAQKTN